MAIIKELRHLSLFFFFMSFVLLCVVGLFIYTGNKTVQESQVVIAVVVDHEKEDSSSTVHPIFQYEAEDGDTVRTKAINALLYPVKKKGEKVKLLINNEFESGAMVHSFHNTYLGVIPNLFFFIICIVLGFVSRYIIARCTSNEKKL